MGNERSGQKRVAIYLRVSTGEQTTKNQRRELGLKARSKSRQWSPRNPGKQIKTAEERAAMIHEDLSKVDGCPEAGVNVTVYGLPWRAMLTFGAAAGPVRNKEQLKGFFRNYC